MVIQEKNTGKDIAIDIPALAAELAASISGEVRFDVGSRATYSTDASNYRQVPIGVVLPKTEADIKQTVAICHKYRVPVLSRGGGTSLAGQCCNVAVVMDMSKYYNHLLDFDPGNKLVRVQPGIVLDEVRESTRQATLTFGPDPATHSRCTIGGMMGNNSCGVHSVMASLEGNGARTSDNIERIKVLTYDGLVLEAGPTSEEELERIIQEGGRKGEIYGKLRNLRDKYASLIREKFPNIPRRVSGYNLDELLPEKGFNVARALVGTEGTCVVYLEATLQLIHYPKERSLLVLGYPDMTSAGHHAPEIMKHDPVGLEGMDEELINYMRERGLDIEDLSLLPEGHGWLMAEFGADTQEEADEQARKVMDYLKQQENPPSMSLFDDKEQEDKLWEVREAGLGATAFVSFMDDTWPGWEDSAVPPEKVGDYLVSLRKLFDKYGYHAALYGHFGQGCIHCRIDFDLYTTPGIEKYKRFTREAARMVVDFGGSLSGEHGDGQARGELLEIMYGKELVQAFREFKEIWDPDWKMNPGKIVEPYHQDENLRLGADYHPAEPETHFKFPNDEGRFSRAVLRCVGVGQCRRHEGGTMCPSYMVTREEEHATRGRARLLFEMLQGEELDSGWKSESVKEALDLCLACKGCKGDCPVHVDMATYKSEFLSHYYEGQLRPASAYAFGWIYWWSRLASKWPEAINFLTQNSVTGSVAKLLAGVSQKRRLPKFAEYTFRDWYRQQNEVNSEKPGVILWADTFNNFFKPETLVAGKEVLEAAGFSVIVPKQMLCCGRPLYDFGMLKTAKKLLLDILEALRDDIRKGTPVVGLEPSCISVFRDELCNLFPADEDAKRLKKQTFTLAEFLEQYAPDFTFPELPQPAVIHGHCHHKSIMRMKAENTLLDKLKLDYQMLDSGCCGMAGYFGYKAGQHYEVGLAAGERVLLPAVRNAGSQTIIMADGFSCREQIEQGTSRKAMHLAQVLQMALRNKNNPEANKLAYPEKKYVDEQKLQAPPGTKGKRIAVVAAISGFFAFGLLIMEYLKEHDPML